MAVLKDPQYQVVLGCFFLYSDTHILVAGFGLGALNDADEDDIDIYDMDLKATRNRLAYDAQHHNDTFGLGEQAKSLKSTKVPSANPISIHLLLTWLRGPSPQHPLTFAMGPKY